MKDADLKALEAKGPEGVLREMMQGLHGDPNSPRRSEIGAWLLSKQLEAEGEATFKRDAHEEKTLSIAKEANRIALEQASAASRSAEAAWEQARWAKWATSSCCVRGTTYRSGTESNRFWLSLQRTAQPLPLSFSLFAFL